MRSSRFSLTLLKRFVKCPHLVGDLRGDEGDGRLKVPVGHYLRLVAALLDCRQRCLAADGR
jgi:hypothetical protein